MEQIIYLKPDELHPYENNPRKNSEAVKMVKQSIQEFGFKNPIIVDKNYVIICGHTRWKAAKQLKLEEVPVIVATDLTEDQVKKFRLIDNKSNEIAEWDYEMLKTELEDLDFGDWGEIDWNLPKEEKEVVEVEVPEVRETDIKLGDMFQLGDHILMCGDSTKIGDVDKLMGGVLCDLVITDPPYNVNYEGTSGKIKNDNMNDLNFKEFLKEAFKNIDSVLKKGASFYIWYANVKGYFFKGACNDVGWKIRQVLIWIKNSPAIGRQDYQWMHEPCIYGWKEGASHKWYSNRKQKTVIETIDLMSEVELKNTIHELFNELNCDTVYCEKPNKNDLHPTMKPIKLLAKFVRNSSKQNDVVLDPFGGSGSTLITCEQMNRKCYTMEFDPKFCQVIIDRWEQFTGKKAEKICMN